MDTVPNLAANYIGAKRVYTNDLVFNKLKAHLGVFAISKNDGLVSPDYAVYTPTPRIFLPYLEYLFHTQLYISEFKKKTTGVAIGFTRLYTDGLFAIYSIYPPLEEQKSIVAYLNKKTAEIDEQVSKVEREIELLKEYKQAEIARVVTHGLNPNAPTKPSGISWIGDIPKHWSIRKLSQVATEYFVSNKSIHHQNLLSLSYGAIVRKDINTTEGLLPASFDTYQVVKKDIIVMRLTDLQNDHRSLRVGIAKEEGIVTSAYTSIKVRETILPNYLYYQLHTNDIHKVFYGMGDGLRQSLNFAGMKNLRLLLPPIEEQEEIVDYINRKTTEIDRLVVELTYQVEYLKEYKQRLIADVVTGKINVQPN
jgi:type I restriction enzyme S subunit